MSELGFTVNKLGVCSLWLLLKHQETASVRVVPLSPCDASYAFGAEFVPSNFIEIPQSLWTEPSGDSEDSECVRVIEDCLDQLYIDVPDGYSLLPLRKIGDKALEKKIVKAQRELFSLSTASKSLPLIANQFYTKAKDMTSSQSKTLPLVADEFLGKESTKAHPESIQKLVNDINEIKEAVKEIKPLIIEKAAQQISATNAAIYAATDRDQFPKRILLTHEKLPSQAPDNEESFLESMFAFFDNATKVLDPIRNHSSMYSFINMHLHTRSPQSMSKTSSRIRPQLPSCICTWSTKLRCCPFSTPQKILYIPLSYESLPATSRKSYHLRKVRCSPSK
jgi:hypothetical protein